MKRSDQIFGKAAVACTVLLGIIGFLPTSLTAQLELNERRGYEEPLGYTYLEAFGENVSLATPLVDSAMGGSARISISPRDQIFVAGWISYAEGDDDVLGFDADASVYVGTLGVGFYEPLRDDFHVMIEVGGIFGELDVSVPDLTGISGLDESFTGAYAMPGARWAVSERFELLGSVLLNTSDYGGDVIFRGQAYLEVFKGIDLSAGGTFGDDVEWLSFGGRLRW